MMITQDCHMLHHAHIHKVCLKYSHLSWKLRKVPSDSSNSKTLSRVLPCCTVSTYYGALHFMT